MEGLEVARPKGEYRFARLSGRAPEGKKVRQHPVALVGELLSLAPKAVVVLTLLVIGSHLAGQPGVGPMVALAAAVAGVWVTGGWANWNTTSLTLTDEYVVLKRGVLGSSKTIRREKIQAIRMKESIRGRLLGYRTVVISTGDGRIETFGMAPRSLSTDDILGPPGFID
jgi:uncharacterized membrane protein YdbT with pleckstrin-like domain